MKHYHIVSRIAIYLLSVVLIIFGPGKLPELGSQVGKAVRDFRRMTNDMTREFNDSTSDILPVQFYLPIADLPVNILVLLGLMFAITPDPQ